MKINTTTLKKLVPIASGTVTHFCKSAGRLYGKLALREQLNYESVTHYTSIEHVDINREDLKREIINLARDCGTTIRRLNIMAKKHNFPAVLANIDELSLTQFIELIDTYITELVADSDFRDWCENIK